MTDKTKSTTRRRSSTPSKTSSQGFSFRLTDFVLIPMSAIVLYCWYYVAINFANLLHGSTLFFNPTFVAVLIAIFGTLFVYVDLTRGRITKYTRVVAYILSALAVWAGIVLLAISTPSALAEQCTWIMGAKMPCGEITKMNMVLFYLNALSLLIGEVLSVSATISLLVSISRKK